MSEIVRPTRDGIHGREYISTSVDIGRKSDHLVFENGELTGSPAPLLEAPMPVIFDAIPERWQRGPVMAAIGRAAAQLGLLSVIRGRRLRCRPRRGRHGHVVGRAGCRRGAGSAQGAQ
jgi:hypothetical protein